MFLFSLFTTISSQLRSYFQTLVRWVEAVLTCAIFICPRQQDLAFVLAAFSLITPKSPLCWRQPLLVFVGRLPTTYTQKNTHAHTCGDTLFYLSEWEHISNEAMGPDKCPSPKSQGLHSRSALFLLLCRDLTQWNFLNLTRHIMLKPRSGNSNLNASSLCKCMPMALVIFYPEILVMS